MVGVMPLPGARHSNAASRVIEAPPSTTVHSLLDRSNADGIGISGPESTNPGTLPRPKKTPDPTPRRKKQDLVIIMRAILRAPLLPTYSGQWPMRFPKDSRR